MALILANLIYNTDYFIIAKDIVAWIKYDHLTQMKTTLLTMRSPEARVSLAILSW